MAARTSATPTTLGGDASPNTPSPAILPKLPRWKKLIYGLLTAALFFVLLEGVLFLAGVQPLLAERDPFVGFALEVRHFEDRGQLGEPPKMRTARNKLAYLNEQSFAIEKPAGDIRIFCLGGSTTFGRPYDDATSFVGWLRVLLEQQCPEKNWEVVNAGGISYASFRVAALVEELCEYEPDLLVVYTGHNEFLEERTYRDVRRRSPTLRRWMLAAARTRTGALLHRAIAPPPTDRAQLREDFETILDRTVGPESYERDDALRRQIVAHYELSLHRIIDLARGVGSSVVLVRPACNLRDCSPLKSQNSEQLAPEARLAWQERFHEGKQFFQQGRFEQAIDALAEARKIDSRHAELHFLWGQAAFALEDFSQAEAAFARAVDEDICPLRITSDLQQALARVADQREVLMVDFPRLLQEDSVRRYGHAVLGREYFLDHVHPTIEAHGQLAFTLAEQLSRDGVLSAEIEFTPATLEAARRQVDSRIDPLAHARAEGNLACVLHWAGKTDEAGPLALDALEHIDSDARLWLIAGIYEHRRGDTQAARTYLERALALSPNDARIHRALRLLD